MNNMSHLQALHVSFEHDTVLQREDKLVDWLREYLPLTCTIARDTYVSR